MASPWSLRKALAHPPAVKPATRSGSAPEPTPGHFTSSLGASPKKPIVVRQYPGERATIDGNYGGQRRDDLDVRGTYTLVWGLRDPQLRAPNARRRADGRHRRPGARRHTCSVTDKGSSTWLSTTPAQGVLTTSGALRTPRSTDASSTTTATTARIAATATGSTSRTRPASKRIVDNIIFRQFGCGIHAYTEGGTLDDLYFEGNTAFNNGSCPRCPALTTNFLIGANGCRPTEPRSSEKVAKKTSLLNNYSYFSSSGGVAANLGYSKGIASPTILDNYLVGGRALALVNAFAPDLDVGQHPRTARSRVSSLPSSRATRTSPAVRRA